MSFSAHITSTGQHMSSTCLTGLYSTSVTAARAGHQLNQSEPSGMRAEYPCRHSGVFIMAKVPGSPTTGT